MTGLFVNVYCVAGVRSFMNPDNPAWMLDLATDTLLVRRLARYRWRYTGIAGLGFLCALCIAAWWYQNTVKKRCERAIAGLEEIQLPAPGHPFHRESISGTQSRLDHSYPVHSR